MGEKAEDYEVGERAAIRELDGGCEAAKAEQLAADDLRGRRSRESMAELQAARDKLGDRLRAMHAGEEKDNLFAQWTELSQAIIEFRKES